jgi:hypothetical protein
MIKKSTGDTSIEERSRPKIIVAPNCFEELKKRVPLEERIGNKQSVKYIEIMFIPVARQRDTL